LNTASCSCKTGILPCHCFELRLGSNTNLPRFGYITVGCPVHLCTEVLLLLVQSFNGYLVRLLYLGICGRRVSSRAAAPLALAPHLPRFRWAQHTTHPCCTKSSGWSSLERIRRGILQDWCFESTGCRWMPHVETYTGTSSCALCMEHNL
jgi:hypothetical protein